MLAREIDSISRRPKWRTEMTMTMIIVDLVDCSIATNVEVIALAKITNFFLILFSLSLCVLLLCVVRSLAYQSTFWQQPGVDDGL